MYNLASILKKNDCYNGQILNLRIHKYLFVILGPENVCLDTNIFFLCELETEILKHVYSGGHSGK